MSLHLVVFYTDPPVGSRPIPGSLSGIRQIELLYQSAALVMDGVELTVLTDPNTDLATLTVPFRRFTRPVDQRLLMLERTRMQGEFLVSCALTFPIAFVDTDILFQASILPVFDHRFDIGLTWRKDENMPLNGGVILVHNRRPEAVRLFFARLAERIVQMPANFGEWYGDQIALMDMLRLTPAEIAASTEVVRDEVTFRLLPCEVYNFTPSKRARALLKPDRDAAVLHFKGDRRPFMETYWRLLLSPRRNAKADLFLSIARLAIVRRLHQRLLRGDQRRQRNSKAPSGRAWKEWARLAADLTDRIERPQDRPLRLHAEVLSESDLGSLLSAKPSLLFTIVERGASQGPSISLTGGPDSSDQAIDIVLCLGLVEYVGSPSAFFSALRLRSSWFIFSYCVKERSGLNSRQAKRLGWQSFMTQSQVEHLLASTGFSIVETRLTGDGQSFVWLCRPTEDWMMSEKS